MHVSYSWVKQNHSNIIKLAVGFKLGLFNPITRFKLDQVYPISGFKLDQFNFMTGFKLGWYNPMTGFKLGQLNPIFGDIMGFFFNPRLDLVAFSQLGKYQSKPINSPFFSLFGNCKKFPVLSRIKRLH